MFDFGAALARVLPLPVTRFFAGVGGYLYALAHPKKVAVVEQNLRLLDPNLGRKAARNVYREFGRTLADYFFLGTRPAEDAARLIRRMEGGEHLQWAHAQGKGAIVVTAHFGLFELGGLLLAQQGFAGTVLTFPEPSSALTEWRTAFRRRWQAGTLEIGADPFAFLEIDRLLREGRFIATLIDRPHATENTTVQLPHGVAQFSAGILLLAARTGVPVIPATMVRGAHGFYHAQVFAPMRIEPRATRAETLSFYSQKIADVFTPVLRAHPEQWYQFVPLNPS